MAYINYQKCFVSEIEKRPKILDIFKNLFHRPLMKIFLFLSSKSEFARSSIKGDPDRNQLKRGTEKLHYFQ